MSMHEVAGLDPDVILKAAAYHGGLVLPPRRWPPQRKRTTTDAGRRARLRGAYIEDVTIDSLVAEGMLRECTYCAADDNLAVDHVWPLGVDYVLALDEQDADASSGGKAIMIVGLHEHDNCVIACRSCNSSKGNRRLTRWWGR